MNAESWKTDDNNICICKDVTYIFLECGSKCLRVKTDLNWNNK